MVMRSKKQTGTQWCPNVVAALLHSMPQTSPRKNSLRFGGKAHFTSCVLTLLTIFACFSMLRFLLLGQLPSPTAGGDGCLPRPWGSLATSGSSWVQPLATRQVDAANGSARERWLWKQPDGAGLVGCIEFSPAFELESARVVAQRERYLMVVVNGGLNQQRNQIVDSVVMAAVLGASLVLPIMEVNPIWDDER